MMSIRVASASRCHHKPSSSKNSAIYYHPESRTISSVNGRSRKLSVQIVRLSDEIVHLYLDNNRLDESAFEGVKFQSVKTLSLRNNRVKDVNRFVKILNESFPNLKSLDILGNPVCAKEDFLEYEEIKDTITSSLPSLKYFNGLKLSKLRESIDSCDSLEGSISQDSFV